MKSLTLLFFFLITGLSLRAETAYEFVDKLYANPNSDLHYPTKASLKLYGKELQGLIQKAIAIRAEYEKKHPGEKPPFADYPLLYSSADSYQRYRIFSSKEGKEDKPLLIVQLFQAPEDKIEPDFAYLYLGSGKTGWQIEEILYLSYRPDLKKLESSKLTEQLRADIKNPQ